MRRACLALTSLVCLFEFSTPANSQSSSSTATGVGIGAAKSNSAAVAISGQGGQGGRGGKGGSSQSNLTINGGSAPSSTSASIHTHSSSDDTVRNVPLVSAPSLTAAGINSCLGSVSGGVGVVGFGGSFGTTVPDPDCSTRLDTVQLWNMGFQREAIVRFCQNPNVYNAMPQKCIMNGYVAAAAPYSGPGPLFDSGPNPLIMFLRGASESQPPTSTEAPPSAADASAAETYHGGPIELVEGKTGKVRTCIDYNEPERYCRAWAHQLKMAVKRK